MQDHPIVSVIDDDKSVRKATARLLNLHGFIAHAFPSAEAFLDSAQLPETSCLITDIRMPGMSGIELQEHLREHGYHTPVILITAFPEARSHARAINSGAVCFLKKPFDAQTLIDCIESALKGRSHRPDE